MRKALLILDGRLKSVVLLFEVAIYSLLWVKPGPKKTAGDCPIRLSDGLSGLGQRGYDAGIMFGVRLHVLDSILFSLTLSILSTRMSEVVRVQREIATA